MSYLCTGKREIDFKIPPPPVFEIKCNKFANVLDKNGLSCMLGKEVVRFRENFIFL